MNRSTDHILISHVGTLPSTKGLDELSAEGEAKREQFEAALPDAVHEIVEREIAAGIDVINDGEFGKEGPWSRAGGFSRYVRSRLTGYELKPLVRTIGREQQQFPSWSRLAETGGVPLESMICTGPIGYIGGAELERDIANLKSAATNKDVAGIFMAAISPDNINYYPGANEYYASEDEYVVANADAMRTEYRTISDAGFVLQIDMPVMKYNALSLTVDEFRGRFARLVEILNYALEGIPEDQIRVHVCYGGGKNPHTGDLNLGDFIDLVFKLNVNGISFDQNVRHDHEWTLFRDVKLPEGKILMPGVVAHTTDTVEHPELVAQRIVRLANLVGRENIIAGTDCGLGGRLHPEIVWAKFKSMHDGAAIATKQLWA